MRVHHLSCATMCPPSQRLVTGEGAVFGVAKMVCHCLLVETRDGLVLVDTGLGTDDVAHPHERLGGPFMTFARPRLDPEETALRQVERLGFSEADVRHIVVTHLDLDHAGGLPDFPRAKVHIMAKERDAALAPASFLERHRYRAAHWAHGPRWATYEARGEPWFGFECVRGLEELPPEILLVPLVGHTRGHAAVAVETADGWLLHAGDAYFFHGEVDAERPHCTPGLAFFQRLVEADGEARMANQARLRALAREHRSDVTLFCAHDVVEFERAMAATSRRQAAHDGVGSTAR